MESIRFLSRAMLTVTVLSLLLAVSVDGENATLCPTGCKCLSVDFLNCTNIDHFPDYANKSLIKKLVISPNKITEIKLDDFLNYTRLEQLDLQEGNVQVIGEGAFGGVKDTIKSIVLKKNNLTSLPKNVFKDLSKLDHLDLDSNHLSKLENNSFSNLESLTTLLLAANRIDEIESDAFKGVPQLENLNFYSNNLKEVPFVSLKQVIGLKGLDLSFNKIDMIPEVVDVFLPALEGIDLDSNPIKNIDVFPNISASLKMLNLRFTHIDMASKDTWKNLPDLVTLYLSGTRFTYIAQGMFEGLPKLQSLYITDTKTLQTIGPNAFSDLPNLETIYVSRNPKLTTIEESAFKSNKNLTSVYLRHNALTSFQQNLLPWADLTVLSVELNPLNCDCKLTWVLNASIFEDNTKVKSSFYDLFCTSPSHLANRKVDSLLPVNLVCGAPADDHLSRATTGILVAVVCLVFITSLCVIVKCRKRILMSTRRYFQYRRYKNEMIFTVENDTSIAELDDTEARPLKEMRLETVPL